MQPKQLQAIIEKTTKDQKAVKQKAEFIQPLLSTKSKRKAFIQKLAKSFE